MSVRPSDAELVAKVLAGSTEAFDALVDRYWNAAVAMAYQRTRRWSDAEDAAQEAFVLAFRKLRNLRGPERFGGWLFTTVQRSCIEVARRRARRPTPLSDVQAMSVSPDESTEDTRDGREVRDEIMQAISELPERYRPVVILRYGQEMPVKAIGETLGLPVGTVVSQLFRANRLLRNQLSHLVAE